MSNLERDGGADGEVVGDAVGECAVVGDAEVRRGEYPVDSTLRFDRRESAQVFVIMGGVMMGHVELGEQGLHMTAAYADIEVAPDHHGLFLAEYLGHAVDLRFSRTRF